jgi:hypothetical protein
MSNHLSMQIFSYLVLGLAKYAEQEQEYPYPPELLYAQHHLSLAMLASYPATITEFFELCKKPLEEWWPGDTLHNVDTRFELLETDGELGQQVIEFLKTYDLPKGTTSQSIQIILESKLMENICRKARKAASYDPDGAQLEYVAARSYVITHPWTTQEKLRNALHDLHHILPQEVGDLYQDSSSVGPALLYQRADRPTPCYWNCNVCGPLYQYDGRLGSIKPGACEKRCPGKQTWQPLDVEENTLVLKRGVHLYTYIPGITEMRLYHWLIDKVRPGSSALQQVELWPGIDSYDLRLTFQGDTWAVDVKDYKDPVTLGTSIKQDTRPPEQADPVWHKWFYVYPMYHELQRPNYGEWVQRTVKRLPSNVSILNEEQFKAQVRARL